ISPSKESRTPVSRAERWDKLVPRKMRSIFRGRATGHGRQQDDRVALGDRRLVAVAGTDVLAADVDVRVLELALQAREAGGQVVEQVADGFGLDYYLALAARRQLRRRRLREEAAIARALMWLEDGRLPLEAEDRPVHERNVVPDRGVVNEVAGREVVGAVDDHVPAVGEDSLDVLRGQLLLVGHDLDVGVELANRALGRLDLRLAERGGRGQDLPLEVCLVD